MSETAGVLSENGEAMLCGHASAIQILRCLAAACAAAAIFASAPGAQAAGAIADPAEEPVVRAVSRVLPTVVNIHTERIIRQRVRDPYEDFFDSFFGGPVRPPREIRQRIQSLGSGFLVDPGGYIITNEHVAERAADTRIQVTTHDGKTFAARYIAGDPESDLACIKIDAPSPLPFLDLRDLSPNLLGQTVIVLGNPVGYGSSVSRGILSAVNRTVEVDSAEFTGLIQTDAAINPGNSGGPIIDIAGRLAGVASVKMAYTPQGVPTQGIGFGIPAQRVRERLASFREAAALAARPTPSAAPPGRTAWKRAGLRVQDLTDELAAAFGLSAGEGVVVTDIEPGGPADEAGLKRGLVIRQIGRYQLSASGQLDTVLERATPGTDVELLVTGVRRIGGRVYQHSEAVSLTTR